MQYQKESVRKAILKAAEDEFIDKGYQQASIRDIAEQAEVAVSNIYNYFSNKDELFAEVLKPILDKIEWGKKFLVDLEAEDSLETVLNMDEHKKRLLAVAKFVEQNRELMQLLMFEAYGSSLENYKEEVFDWYVSFWLEYVEAAEEQVEVSELVIRNIAGVWYNLLEEILRYEVTGEDLEELVEDMSIFGFGGWNKLVAWKKAGD